MKNQNQTGLKNIKSKIEPQPMHCVVPENIHTHPKDGQWKFRGGGGLQGQFLRESLEQN